MFRAIKAIIQVIVYLITGTAIQPFTKTAVIPIIEEENKIPKKRLNG